jgi:hypothetical protein
MNSSENPTMEAQPISITSVTRERGGGTDLNTYLREDEHHRPGVKEEAARTGGGTDIGPDQEVDEQGPLGGEKKHVTPEKRRLLERTRTRR